MGQVALFEDHHWKNLNPITFTRVTFDVKVGARSFFEEYSCCGGQRSPEVLLTRKYLEKVTAERHDGCTVNPGSVDPDTIFVNGLLHPATIEFERLRKVSHTFAITSGDRLLVARLSKKAAEYLRQCVIAGRTIDLKRLEVNKSTELRAGSEGLISNLWDVIHVIENSLSVQTISPESSSDLSRAKILGQGAVVAEGATIEEGTVLDTKNGGIYIGPKAIIAPSRIVGPAHIGSQTQVKQFSIIEASYIGRNCRIAGEIEHSVIMDYTNKAHAGFVGHSYVGEWTNLGAMTSTSDLKMTYGSIRMENGKGIKLETALNKVGSFFADMSKTSIGTLIYSGRRIGVSSHLHGLVTEDVPSFTIYGKSIGAKNVELEIESAIKTQKKMMQRRGQSMSKAYEQMMQDIFIMTLPERRKARVQKARFSV